MKPFTNLELIPNTTMNKLFKKPGKQNPIVEINNILAEADSFSITESTIAELNAKYSIDIVKQCHSELEELYSKFLQYVFLNEENAELQDSTIQKMEEVFKIPEEKAASIRYGIVGPKYLEMLQKFLEDEYLTDEEYRLLDTFSTKYRLSENVITDLHTRLSSEILKRKFNQIITDGRVSPEEEQLFLRQAENLRVNLKLDENAQDIFNNGKIIWRIENDTLPIIENVPILLQKNEKCHYTARAGWHELVQVTKRIDYSGPTFRMKIAKGIYYRAGSIQPKMIKEEKLQLIDTGEVYLTSKRIIFRGKNKVNTVPYSSLVDLEVYSDGIRLIKAQGKSPIITINSPSILAAYIARLLM